MKKLVYRVGPFLFLMVISVSVFASESVPPVGAVKIDQVRGCGAPPPPGVTLSCPTTTTLSFVASTTGSCESFSAKLDPAEDGNGSILKITKFRLDNCTRPEHPAKQEAQHLNVGGDLPNGPIFLANPIEVNVYFPPV